VLVLSGAVLVLVLGLGVARSIAITSTSRSTDKAPPDPRLSNEQYFAFAYVDAARHRFRPHHAVPWLAGVFGM
jgi:hypothetical protein